jgi:hypothetical protein
MKKLLRRVVLIATATALPALAQQAPGSHELGNDPCALSVPSASVVVHGTDNGSVLDFSAVDPAEANDLRQRVRDFAAQRQAEAASPPTSAQGVGGSGPAASPPMPPVLRGAQVEVQPTNSGARLLFTTRDPKQVAAVQRAAREEADLLERPDCKVGMPPPGQHTR